MASSLIRIKPRSREVLQAIAKATGRSVQEELDQAIEDRRRRIYLEGVAADYARLKKDAKAWAQFRTENDLWESTSSDGAKGI